MKVHQKLKVVNLSDAGAIRLTSVVTGSQVKLFHVGSNKLANDKEAKAFEADRALPGDHKDKKNLHEKFQRRNVSTITNVIVLVYPGNEDDFKVNEGDVLTLTIN